MKKIIFFLLALSPYITTFATSTAPWIKCDWLPWCPSSWTDTLANSKLIPFLWKLIAEIIKYTAVIAVIALMFAWIMYITSWWEDETTKKAKKWIIYSLIGVFVSISAYLIVNIINNTNITI